MTPLHPVASVAPTTDGQSGLTVPNLQNGRLFSKALRTLGMRLATESRHFWSADGVDKGDVGELTGHKQDFGDLILLARQLLNAGVICSFV